MFRIRKSAFKILTIIIFLNNYYRNILMSELANIFFGVPQSRYAALAILLAIVVVALTIILGNSPYQCRRNSDSY